MSAGRCIVWRWGPRLVVVVELLPYLPCGPKRARVRLGDGRCMMVPVAELRRPECA